MDWTASIRSPRDQARISELEAEVTELKRLLEVEKTEVRVWRGRYEHLETKIYTAKGALS